MQTMVSTSGRDIIVLSDSDSDTLGESERLTPSPSLVNDAKRSDRNRPPVPSSDTSSSSSGVPATSSRTQSSFTPIAGLLHLIPDRRQLEQERRERARKRRREQHPHSDSTEDKGELDTKRSKAGPAAAPIQPHKEQTATTIESLPSTSSSPQQNKTKPSVSSRSGSSAWESATDPIQHASRYWNGTVKHGYNQYADSRVCGVSLSQMLLPATASSRNGLQLAVLATYDLRMDWLYSLFPRGLPVTLVLPPPKDDYRSDPTVARPGLHPSEIFGDFSRSPGWHICVPAKPKGGWLTQHMKFLILVHQDFLRVAILSGNLNAIDWERIENTAYIQDFPCQTAPGSRTPTLAAVVDNTTGNASGASQHNDFRAQLVRTLRSLSLPPSHPVYAALDRHDFSSATRARIVASWPEASTLAGWDRIETQGLGRLSKVVRDLRIGASRANGVSLECQGSSLANHDKKWIEHFHLLASGCNPRGILPLRGKANDTHPEYLKASGLKTGSLPPIKVCFPSHRYVEDSTVEGPPGALSFFGKAEHFAVSP